MITPADDYPIHQTAEPIAYSGTDRNFYDRYFFNGYSADGSVFFAIALGVYPHLNIIDGAFSLLKEGQQSSVFLSRVLNHDRMDTSIGPFRIDVLDPLKRLKITLAETEGLGAELIFNARARPIEEPRFNWRQGSRTLIDCTRMTQNGLWSGKIQCDGQEISLLEGWTGTRDRSWGVRPIGAADGNPVVPFHMPQFYWMWTPLNFADRSFFFHLNDDAHGHAWNTKAVMIRDGDDSPPIEMAKCEAEINYLPGTRRVKTGRLIFTDRDNKSGQIDLTPLHQFQMKGIGYRHPKWTHGAYISDEASWAREDWRPDDLTSADMHNLHIQAVSKARLTDAEGRHYDGFGSFEQLFVGPHAPSGFQSILDGAS
mgnify:CR=1 FL=1